MTSLGVTAGAEVAEPSWRARLAACREAWVSRLFAADDAAARELGWSVQETAWGRLYRAPGFPRRPVAQAPGGEQR